jgi:hypothetical protein
MIKEESFLLLLLKSFNSFLCQKFLDLRLLNTIQFIHVITKIRLLLFWGWCSFLFPLPFKFGFGFGISCLLFFEKIRRFIGIFILILECIVIFL